MCLTADGHSDHGVIFEDISCWLQVEHHAMMELAVPLELENLRERGGGPASWPSLKKNRRSRSSSELLNEPTKKKVRLDYDLQYLEEAEDVARKV